MVSVSILESLLSRFRQIASAWPDARTGANQRYSIADAASCALATFFFQAPSFLDFQRRMQKKAARSNCQSLFAVDAIPCDNTIRNLLDGPDPDHCAPLFADCLQAARDHGALQPFLRLDGRIAVALDGIQFQGSNSIHCDHCSTRHVGKHKTVQYFHTMLAAAILADGHNRALPLLPHFVQPQHNPHDGRSDDERKQDCEGNAAKRWLPAYIDLLRPYRPIILGDDLVVPRFRVEFIFRRCFTIPLSLFHLLYSLNSRNFISSVRNDLEIFLRELRAFPVSFLVGEMTMPPAASTMKPRQMLAASDGAEVEGHNCCSANLRTSALYLNDASGAVEPLNRKGSNYDLPLLLSTERPARAQPQRNMPISLPLLRERHSLNDAVPSATATYHLKRHLS